MAKRTVKRWSRQVTETSDALDLDSGVFSREDPRSIARSLKRSADRSRRRKSDPFRSAMSMLTFYINRAGKNLSKTRRARLEAAKDELRELYHRDLEQHNSPSVLLAVRFLAALPWILLLPGRRAPAEIIKAYVVCCVEMCRRSRICGTVPTLIVYTTVGNKMQNRAANFHRGRRIARGSSGRS